MQSISRKRSGAATVALSVAVLATSGVSWAQDTGGRTSPQAAAQQQPQMQHKGPDEADAQELMTKRAEMMAQMKALDTTLDDLVATLKQATGSAKVDAVAAVVTELASQRRQMRQMMMSMQMGMMGHMMQHMQGGGGTAAGCPMMKGMGKMGGAADDHQQHHPRPEAR